MIYDSPLIGFAYRHSPLWAQHALVSSYGFLQVAERLSPAYRRYRAELEASQWHSPEALKCLQDERLQAIVRHAYENVPYYRRVFDELKLKPSDIQTGDDLYKLPVITRPLLRRHYADLRARNVPKRHATIGKSGGTTGVAAQFMLDHERIIFDHAVTYRHWSWAGYRFGDRVVVQRYLVNLFAEARGDAHWRFDRFGNRIYLSASYAGGTGSPRYVEKLRQWRPKFLSGFTLSIAALARYMESQGIQIPLQACFTSSEMLTPADRAVIEHSFACRVWDRYGLGERLAVAQQCEQGNYHQSVEFGVLQVDDPPGTPAPPGSQGQLVLTGLTNFSMPLIRYASGDLGQLIDGRCACGRGLPLMGPVEGRTGDMLVTPDGRLISAANLGGFATTVPNAERCQLIQKRNGETIVRVQPGPGFGEADAAELLRQLSYRVGPGMTFRIELVDDFEAPLNSKFRYIVSEMELGQASASSTPA